MAINFLNNIDVTGEVKGTSLDINGNADISGSLTLAEYIYHGGDTTNYHRFLSNRQIFVVGNASSIDLNNGVSTFGSTSGATTLQAQNTTQINLSSSEITCLVADTDVFQITETDYIYDPAVKVSIHKRKLAKTSNTDGDADGDIVYFGGTTSMTAGGIYHYKSDGTWEKADADAAANCDGLLAVALGTASDTNGMLVRGMATIANDPGAVGDVLFLSTTAGQATATAPSGDGDIVRVIGYCLDASNGQIYFNPDGTFVEVTA